MLVVDSLGQTLLDGLDGLHRVAQRLVIGQVDIRLTGTDLVGDALD